MHCREAVNATDCFIMATYFFWHLNFIFISASPRLKTGFVQQVTERFTAEDAESELLETFAKDGLSCGNSSISTNTPDYSLIDDLSASCYLLDSSIPSQSCHKLDSVNLSFQDNNNGPNNVASEGNMDEKLDSDDSIKDLVSRFLHIRSQINSNAPSSSQTQEVVFENLDNGEKMSKATINRSGLFKLDETLFQNPSP